MRLLISCCLLVALRVWAPAAETQATIPVHEIRRVTLYRDQALVTRGVSIPTADRDQELLIGPLPVHIVADSIHAEAANGLVVRNVRLVPQPTSAAQVAEAAAVNERLVQAQKSLAATTQQMQFMQKKLDYMDRLMSFSTQTAHTDLSHGVLESNALIAMSDYVLDNQRLDSQEFFDLQQQHERLAVDVQGLQQELGRLTRSTRQQLQARLIVRNATGQAETVELSYLVSACGWSPQYTVHGRLGQASFGLTYEAVVVQTSGEDWNGVQLSLSTASPDTSAAGPSLTPFRVQVVDNFAMGGLGVEMQAASDSVDFQSRSAELRQQQSAVESQYAAKNSEADNRTRDVALNAVANTLQSMELQVASGQLKSLAADAADQLANQVYPIEQAISLASQPEQQFVQILRTELTGELYHVATPLLSSFAYREADLVNDRREGLLGGPATVYLDHRFVGQTAIPSIASGQHLIVGFGADPQVRTRRELLDKLDEVQGGNRHLTFKVRLVLANFKDEPVEIRLFDRLPLAGQASQVSVQPLEFDQPVSQDGLYARLQRPKGVLRWDLLVPAERFGEAAYDVDYSFRVEFDRNQELLGSASTQQLQTDYLELGPASGMGGMGGMGGGMMGGQPGTP